ncbi:unnamed protein product [Arabidopsis halleri]
MHREIFFLFSVSFNNFLNLCAACKSFDKFNCDGLWNHSQGLYSSISSDACKFVF